MTTGDVVEMDKSLSCSFHGQRRLRCASALALLLALGGAGCEVDYKAPLVGGYDVVRANSSYVVVNGPMVELPTVI